MIKTGKTKEIIPLPFPVYLWTTAVLAFAGLCDSAYLAVNHFRNYTDLGYSSFCAISRAINCDTVAQSPYSILAGLPVAVWGMIGYIFLLLFIFFAGTKKAENKRIWPSLFLFSFVFSMFSLFYAFISIYSIHSFCIMCIISYGLNFFLLFYTWLVKKRFENKGLIAGLKKDLGFIFKNKDKFFFIFSPFIICVIIIYIFFPAYWNVKPPPVSDMAEHGITIDGHPWTGAKKTGAKSTGTQYPLLIINEFTDYQCFQCKKMHFFLRRLLVKYPGRIRLIHRNFPMDSKVNPLIKQNFHTGSGAMALFSIYAASKGKFWEINDALFNIDRRKKSVNIKKLAEKEGLDISNINVLYNKNIRKILLNDIREGLSLGITGTPSYVIDGRVYLGNIPPEILKKVIN